MRRLLALLTALPLFWASPVSANPAHSTLGPDTNHLLRTVDGTSLSLNWSGYAVVGKFHEARGTFTVPNCAPGGTGNASEWVGIDGYNNTDLIQAGVDESQAVGEPCDIYAWWEILPAASVPITMKVAAGDQVTVGILKEPDGQWGVDIYDQATGQDFFQTFAYGGPAKSAEWIVEAPTVFGLIPNILPYQSVTWTGLEAQGHAGILDPVYLVQSGKLQSLPSAIGSARQLMKLGFTSEYVG